MVRLPLLPWSVRWLGAVVVAAVLVYFSLLTTPPAGPPDPSLGSFWDKKLHFAGYAALGLSLIYATAASRRTRRRRAVLAIGTTVAFGVLVELLQGPLPDRYFSYADMLANALGALLASVWLLVESRLEYVRIPHRGP
jgi:VanZ family protein